MFNFLKDKLKGAISKISRRAEEEGEIEEINVPEDPQDKVEEPVDKKEEHKEKKEVKDALAELDVEEIEEPKKEITEKVEKEPISEEESKESEALKELEEEKPVETDEAPKVEVHETTEPIKVEEPEVLKEDETKFEIEQPEEVEKEKREAAVKIPSAREMAKDAKLPVDEPEEKKQGFFSKLMGKKKEPEQAEPTVEEKVQSQNEDSEEPEEKKGFFSKVTEKIVTTKISSDKFEDLFSDLEMILLENNVAVEVIDKIKSDLEKDLVDTPIKRTKVEDTIVLSLKNSIENLFDLEKIDLVNQIKEKSEKPYVIAFFGINGSGKTTSIAKLAQHLKDKGFSVVLAAADTFRAAAVEQLEHHGGKIGVTVIKQDYGSDPAAVAFDAIKHAQSKNIDVVLIDTAGRLHSNTNLLGEMEKIIRVAKPDLKVFVGESITGNDCIEQAKSFNESVGIDGLILTKADVDEKGGAAISVGYVTGRPIMYIGVGQEYTDLKEFDSKLVVESLGL